MKQSTFGSMVGITRMNRLFTFNKEFNVLTCDCFVIIDSLEHRAQVRAGLAVNTDWIQRYFAKILPWMTGQQNSVISVVPGITFSNSEGKGFYQLQTINYQLNKNVQKELKKSPMLKSKQGDLLVGAFTTCHGNLNTAVLLWKHSTLTAATQLVNEQLKGKIKNIQQLVGEMKE